MTNEQIRRGLNYIKINLKYAKSREEYVSYNNLREVLIVMLEPEEPWKPCEKCKKYFQDEAVRLFDE